MRYWIVRGRPDENDFYEMLKIGKSGTWVTGTPPTLWSPGDRLFFWGSSPLQSIVGLGELRGINDQRNEYNLNSFRVKYLTPVLDYLVHVDELRRNPVVSKATFLKRGPAQTVLALTEEQAAAMYGMVVSRNPKYRVWPDVSFVPFESVADLVEREKEAVTAPFEPEDILDARQRVAASIVQRQGQPKFRQELMRAYKKTCAFTGCNVPAALEAAHIIPYLGPDTNNIKNGLLLRADIHTLFDLHLISVNTRTMTIVVSPKIRKSTYADLAGKQVFQPANDTLLPSVEALDSHRKEARL